MDSIGRASRAPVQRADDGALAPSREREAAVLKPSERMCDTTCDFAAMLEDALVSVVVPCHNAESTLGRTLESIQRQTHRNFEALIVDDGSTDGSRAIALRFASTDSRFRVLVQSNAGVAAARNAGCAGARGQFVAPLDADDLWAPNKLAAQLAAFRAPEVGAVYCWFDNIDARDHVFGGGFRYEFEGDVLEKLCRVDFIGNGSNAMMRLDLVRDVGGYDESLRGKQAEGCEDWKLSLRLAERAKFAVVRRALVGYRVTSRNMSSRTPTMTHSARLVCDEFASHRPELAAALRLHQVDREVYGLIRSVKRGRWGDAAVMAGRVSRFGPIKILSTLTNFSLKALSELPRRMREKLVRLLDRRARTPWAIEREAPRVRSRHPRV